MSTEQELRDALKETPEWQAFRWACRLLKHARKLQARTAEGKAEQRAWRVWERARDKNHTDASYEAFLCVVVFWESVHDALRKTPETKAVWDAMYESKCAECAMHQTPEWKALQEFLDKKRTKEGSE